MTPYYADSWLTVYQGDARAVNALAALRVAVEAPDLGMAPDFTGKMLRADDGRWVSRREILALIDGADTERKAGRGE